VFPQRLSRWVSVQNGVQVWCEATEKMLKKKQLVFQLWTPMKDVSLTLLEGSPGILVTEKEISSS